MKTITRGGQIFSHSFRMTKQVVRTAFLLSLGIWLLWVVYYITTTHLYQKVYWIGVGAFAEFKLFLSKFFLGSKAPLISYYDFMSHSWKSSKASSFLKSSLYTKTLQETYIYSTLLAYSFLIYGTTFLLTLLYFLKKGIANSSKALLRGGRLVSDRMLRLILKKEGKASPLSIGTIPLVKNTETQHILLCGTSGSGKTTWMHYLMPSIRKKKQKAVIVDVVGSFIERYFRPDYDIILNPFDARSAYWTPWADINEESSYESITTAMTSMSSVSSTHSGAFFDTTASILLKCLLKKLREEKRESNKALYDLVAGSSFSELESYLKGTSGAILASPLGKETTLSIRATLLMKLEALNHLEDKEEKPFSISAFMQEKTDRCLFLTMPKAEHLEPLRNLVATWMNVAILSLMNLPEDLKRRCWFLLDELPALGKIPSLIDAVTRMRKYGGCLVASIQNLSQLDSLYGHNNRETLLGNFNTKAIFRSTNISTAEYFSKILGQAEQRRMQENITYGAHEMRDGISLNELEKIDNIVLPSELTSLNDRECFVRLPGNYPIAKTKLSLKKAACLIQPFIPKEKIE